MTHGSHWECLVKDVEEFFATQFNAIVFNSHKVNPIKEFGFNIETNKVQENEIDALCHFTNDFIAILSIFVNKSLFTSYPVANIAYDHEVIIKHIKEEDNLVEAQISCQLKEDPNFTFTFFDTAYFKNKSRYKIDEAYTFYISAFVYGCKKNQYINASIPIGSNEDIKITEESVIFIFNEDGDIDDYKLIAPIIDIEELTDKKMGKLYKITTLLNNESKPYITLMVSENNLENDYIPKIGDSINCAIWMCGVLKK